MQKEIDHLKKKLHHARQRRTPSFSDPSSKDSQGSDYRPRSRTPLSETFSYEEDDLRDHKGEKPSSRGLGNDAMSRALHQISKSPFTRRVEKGKLPRWFTQPTFTIYNGQMDPVEHVGLPTEHDLRKSLTKKPVRSVRRLMDRIDEYKWIEEDQQQGKGKAKVILQDRRGFRSDRYNYNRPMRDFAGQSGSSTPQAVNTVFHEPVQQILEKICHESYFKWPNKMARDPMKRNQNLHCHYHQERGHTTKNCRTLWNHLEQLVREGRLKQFLYQPNGKGDHSGSVNQGNNASRPPLGTINVIFATPRRTGSCPTKVMSVSRTLAEEYHSEPKRIKGNTPPILGFLEEDKVGTIQPHDDDLVVTLRIGGYDVKRVMVDQGSRANIMYPDLFKGLNLKLEDLTAYDSPLISFEGKAIIPKWQIWLPVQSSSEVVDVDFIVVDAYSPYTVILARPRLHALGAVSSTLHVKVKFPSGGLIEEIIRSQSVARQCITAANLRQAGQESSASAEGGS
ncbi:uncharacterized protein LOC142632428 [Castanea sativa]|uniref:uncharacterized protein LOC142632428 n=1 Tax=Castanea sativa TaxID=21020 RepID=UPI003F6513F4